MIRNHLVIRALLLSLLGMASIAIALETAISSRPPEYARSMRV